MTSLITNNTINIDRCKQLVNIVKKLSKTETEELFKMIHKNIKNYTRNNNGVFINLAWVDNDILEKIEQYVHFCSSSRI